MPITLRQLMQETEDDEDKVIHFDIIFIMIPLNTINYKHDDDGTKNQRISRQPRVSCPVVKDTAGSTFSFPGFAGGCKGCGTAPPLPALLPLVIHCANIISPLTLSTVISGPPLFSLTTSPGLYMISSTSRPLCTHIKNTL